MWPCPVSVGRRGAALEARHRQIPAHKVSRSSPCACSDIIVTHLAMLSASARAVLHWKHASAPAALAGAGGAAGAAAAATLLLHTLLTQLPRCFTLGAGLAAAPQSNM